MDTADPEDAAAAVGAEPDPHGRWRSWSDARPEPTGLHLDSAAAGRSSRVVLEAVAEHARREAAMGAYVAQEAAAGLLAEARGALARLLGAPAEGVAFVESATVALAVLLSVWPLEPEATVGVAPSEWGPNLAAFAHRGMRPVHLPVDGDGHVDVVGLERQLASAPPSVVHVTQVASHRPLVQPVSEIATVCRAAGVPLFVDAAQALGHVDTATGADAVYATSRKWLTGPRGVGVLAVSGPWTDAVRAGALSSAEAGPLGDDEPLGTLLSSREAHVAGRVGLGVAAGDHIRIGPSAVWERLAAVGRASRQALAALEAWEVVGPIDDPSAITALRPTAGQDVASVRARLLGQHGIVTTAQQVFRAPGDMRGPTLRVSPHVDATPEDLERLYGALAAS